MKLFFLLVLIFAVILNNSITGDDETDGITIEWYLYYTNYDTTTKSTTKRPTFTFPPTWTTTPFTIDDLETEAIPDTPNRTHHMWFSFQCIKNGRKVTPVWFYDIIICDEYNLLLKKSHVDEKQMILITRLQSRQYDEREAAWLWYIELYTPATQMELGPDPNSNLDKEPLEENFRYKRLQCEIWVPIWKYDKLICKELFELPKIQPPDLAERLRLLRESTNVKYNIRERKWKNYVAKKGNLSHLKYDHNLIK